MQDTSPSAPNDTSPAQEPAPVSAPAAQPKASPPSSAPTVVPESGTAWSRSDWLHLGIEEVPTGLTRSDGSPVTRQVRRSHAAAQRVSEVLGEDVKPWDIAGALHHAGTDAATFDEMVAHVRTFRDAPAS